MIEQIMIFALGALTAALLAIALLPALWRRAVRLTRAELEATMPLTPGEISAEKDQIRATYAVEIRKIETRLEASDGVVQQARVEIGEKLALIQHHEATISGKSAKIDDLSATLALREAKIVDHEETIATLERERDNLATNLSASRISNQALDQETINLRQLADQGKVRQADLERQAETLTTRLAESQNSVLTLKADLAKRSEELRASARALRDAGERGAQLERLTAGAETLAQDRQATIDDLQAERMKLIDDLGTATRERDFEKVEREAASLHLETLTRQTQDQEASLQKNRIHASDVVRDLTRTIEMLRQEKQQADSEISAMRFEKSRVEADLLRLKKRLEPTAETAGSVSAS